MTSMLEKMAAAMYRGAVDHWATSCDPGRCEIGPTLNLSAMARAALLAIREPERDVLQKGITAIEDAHDTSTDSYETYLVTNGADYALPGWQAMIDAILDEKVTGERNESGT